MAYRTLKSYEEALAAFDEAPAAERLPHYLQFAMVRMKRTFGQLRTTTVLRGGDEVSRRAGPTGAGDSEVDT